MAKVSGASLLTLAIKGRQNITVGNTTVLFNTEGAENFSAPFQLIVNNETILVNNGIELIANFNSVASKVLVKRINLALEALEYLTVFVFVKGVIYKVENDGNFVEVNVHEPLVIRI